MITALAISCGTSSGAANSDSGPVSPDASTSCDSRYVSSGDVGAHSGEEITVCGKIVDYYYATGDSRKPTLLLFDQGAPREGQRRILKPDNQFSVVVYREVSELFPPNIGAFYVGKIVCATGVVEVYDNNAVIFATTPDQLVEGC